MTPEERSGAMLLSAMALASARCGDWLTAGAQVVQVQTEYGFRGVQILMIGLADTLLYHQGGFTAPGVPVAPLWVSRDGTATADADQVRPSVRWAGRFIAARAADDLDACNALVQACSTDAEFSENVCALLEACATTLNAMAAPGVMHR